MHHSWFSPKPQKTDKCAKEKDKALELIRRDVPGFQDTNRVLTQLIGPPGTREMGPKNIMALHGRTIAAEMNINFPRLATRRRDVAVCWYRDHNQAIDRFMQLVQPQTGHSVDPQQTITNDGTQVQETFEQMCQLDELDELEEFCISQDWYNL